MKKREQVYVDPKTGDLLVLKERIPANAHDRIYVFEIPSPVKGRAKSMTLDTMLSPGKAGFKCLGAL